MDPNPDDRIDFKKPPVVEIVGSVQFAALPSFGVPQLLALASATGDLELSDVAPALPPLVETERPSFGPETFMQFGGPSHRGLFTSRSEPRFLQQLQGDRIMLNERRLGLDPEDHPSSTHVIPRLLRAASVAQETLATGQPYGPSRPNLVELAYVNLIEPVPGIWESVNDAAAAVTLTRRPDSVGPFRAAESVELVQRYRLEEGGGAFAGHLTVDLRSAYTETGPVLQLQLTSRRVVPTIDSDLTPLFEACHEDVVSGFCEVTTEEMQNHWERIR